MTDQICESQLEFKRGNSFYFLPLFFLPIAILFSNESWIFQSFEYSYDPWGYAAFFHNFPILQNGLVNERVIGRIPWNFVGYIVNQLFPLPYSNYVLHLGFYYLTILSLYFILTHLFSERTGLLTSILMGSYSWFLIPIGSDMPDGAGAAYGLCSCALVVISRNSKWAGIALFFAGCFSGAMLHTNLGMLIFFFFQLCFFFLLKQKCSIHEIVEFFSKFFFGFFSITVLGMGISKYYGGPLFFFANQLWFGVKMVNDPALFAQFPIDWIWSASWLVVPTAILIGSVIEVFFPTDYGKLIEGNHGQPIFSGFFLKSYIVVFLIYCVLNFGGQTWLKNFNYSGLYFPFVCLALGDLLWKRFSRLSERQFNFLSGFSVMVCSVVFSPQIFQIVLKGKPDCIWLILGVWIFIFWFWFKFPKKDLAIYAIVFLFSVNSAWVSDLKRLSPDGGEKIKSAYLFTIEIAKKMRKVFPDFRSSDKIWFSEKDIFSNHFFNSSIVYCSFGTWNKLGAKFVGSINPGDRIIVLDSGDQKWRTIRAALAFKEIEPQLISKEKIVLNPFEANLLYFEIPQNQRGNFLKEIINDLLE